MIRVIEFGGNSYWPKTMEIAMAFIQQIRERNGCGMVEQRRSDGMWAVTHRFDRNDLVVSQ